MSWLSEKLILDDGPPRARDRTETPVEAVLARLQAGGFEATGLVPAELIAVLAFAALGGPDSAGPALARQRPRSSGLSTVLAEPSLAALFPSAPRPTRLALSAGLLQAHDFWDLSHEAAQEAEDRGERSFSAYWHGIAHRREPDAGNAAYWFRRVGRHPVFERLAPLASELAAAAPAQAARVVGPGGWNPLAMIDLCTSARPGGDTEVLARRLQRLEMELLLEATIAAIDGPSRRP